VNVMLRVRMGWICSLSLIVVKEACSFNSLRTLATVFSVDREILAGFSKLNC
jgi:hypothetical protein